MTDQFQTPNGTLILATEGGIGEYVKKLEDEVQVLRTALQATYSRGSPAGHWLYAEVYQRETAPLRDRIAELEAALREQR